jgi:hypothetical protein
MAQDAVNSILNSSVGLIGDSDAVSAEALGAFTGVAHQHLASAHPNSLGKIGVPQGTDGGRVHGTKKIKINTITDNVQTCLTTRKCSSKTRRPKVKPLTPRIQRGALSRAQIRRVILAHKAAYQHCYERQLQKHRHLRGKVELLININGMGRVSLAKVVDNTMKNAQVGRCILKRVRTLRFPTVKDQQSTIVRYPLRFESN